MKIYIHIYIYIYLISYVKILITIYVKKRIILIPNNCLKFILIKKFRNKNKNQYMIIYLNAI